MEAVAARRNDRILKLQDHLVAKARGVGQITCCAADGGHEPVVGVHMDLNLMGKGRHV